MNITKIKYTKTQKPVTFEQSSDPATGKRKAKIEYDKSLKLTSLCSVVGRWDQAIFTVELTEEEVCDLYERLKEKFK